MRRANDEQGFVLVTAIILLVVIMGLGMGLLLYTDSQQTASSRQQYTETAFNVSEAALNAQIGQLAREWPGSGTAEAKAKYAESCTEGTSTASNFCPTSESLKIAYPSTGTTCSAGSKGDAWGSSTANTWTTYVRDDMSGEFFNSALEKTALNYDANGNGKVWVRATGVVNCRVVSIVSLVAEQLVAANFPQSVVTANWFTTTNQGNKEIVNRRGKASQNGEIYVRCKNPHPATCANYREGQISPPPATIESTSNALTEAQLASLKAEAKLKNTFYSKANGTCPSSMAGLAGYPVWIEGCENLSFTGNGAANTEAEPGFLILYNGTLSLGGTTNFYGEIYAVDTQGSSESVVSLQGNTKVVGSIEVDNVGGIEFGSSKENLEYNPGAIEKLQYFAGAAGTRNSFRILPASE